MKQPTLLVLGQPDLAERIQATFGRKGWDVETAALVPFDLSRAVEAQPSAVLLDAREDSTWAAQLCLSLRSLHPLSLLPVIALTRKKSSNDRLIMLEAGADGCLLDSADPRELLILLGNIEMRLRPTGPGRVLRFDQLELDVDGYRLRSNGRSVHLSVKRLQVLRYLMDRPGVVVPRRELLENVWYNIDVDEGAVTACIMRVRQALVAIRSRAIIRHVQGTRGYILETAEPSFEGG